jgi:tetratricopeptide (TPR) repeat protein
VRILADIFVLTVTLTLPLASQNRLAEGQSAFQAGDLARAESLFRDHLRSHPNSAEALSNLGAVMARREQYADAIRYYEQALKADRKLTPVWFNLGVAQLRASHYAGAAASFRSFLESHPNETRGRQLLGLCLVETGDLEAGIAELEQVFEKAPGDRSIHLLSQAESNPAQAALLRGLLHYRDGRFDQARAHFEETLRLEPGNAAALAAAGRLYLRENRDAEAIDYLHRALARNPHDAESTYQLGVLLDRNGKTAEGVALLRKSIELRAAYADPYYQLARIAHRDQRTKDALADIERAASLLPEHEAVRLLRGRIYQALGRAAEAKLEFAAVRRIKERTVARDQLAPEIPLQ